jgi:hypothetical protein
MTRIQRMAKLGTLPPRLAKCRIPVCQSCMYRKLTRRAWRSKPTDSPTDNRYTFHAPGMRVSVDQLESPLQVFVGQLKGLHRRKRYIFVDNFSNLSFVHLRSTANSEDTVQAKHVFERYVSSCCVAILHYNTENGRIADNAWRQDILTKGQRLSFSDVGSHYQNGRAEKRICDL